MVMLSDVFRVHGGFCARHPWEVIFVVLTATVCIVSSGLHCNNVTQRTAAAEAAGQNQPLDVVLMTLVRCVAVLYSYHKLRSLHRSHSRFALGLAGIFTVFSSFVFTCSVVNLMHSDLSDLKDALFFFLLLIDVVKACALAHWSLSCSARNAAEVAACIEQGMAILGPAITLDTAVETLVIGIGTLSGVRRLEVLCSYGCMSALVNYIVFMTFYPACLSLVLELSGKRIDMADDGDDKNSDSRLRVKWQQQVKLLKQILAAEQPNPVVQRVKVIMSAGLMVVHARCRFTWNDEEHIVVLDSQAVPVQESPQDDWVLRVLSPSADQLVLLILVLALTVKFTFFDDRPDGKGHPLTMNLAGSFADSGCALSASSKYSSAYVEGNERFLDKHELLRPRTISVVVGDDSDSEDHHYSPEMIHQEVQTEPLLDPSFAKTGPGAQGSSISSLVEKETQTVLDDCVEEKTETARSIKDCAEILKTHGGSALSDEEILNLIGCHLVAAHQLEKVSGHPERGVTIRRKLLSRVDHPQLPEAMNKVPFTQYDYSKVVGACCENVIGYMPVPLGVVGPLLIDGVRYYVPMATTEGCLVASTNRGCRALVNGVNTRLVADGMSRGPVVRLPNIDQASKLIEWLSDASNLDIVKSSFNSTSRFAKLQKVRAQIAGRHLFLRFVAKTGDAMGMNMVSKGTEAALNKIRQIFPDMEIVSLSGNFCTDKKPAAINWLDGRGKSVVCEAVVKCETVEKILKTSVAALVDLNITKNLMGSAMAGSVGGFNAHAANIVTAIFIATGQDPAQVVTSSNCMTLMEPWGPEGRDLYISCSMPSLEIGTVGGGTGLDAQGACLQMLGVQGSNADNPGENAARLARIVCATVLAGELSLMSALAAGHLVKSHMTHNRSSVLLMSQSCNR